MPPNNQNQTTAKSRVFTEGLQKLFSYESPEPVYFTNSLFQEAIQLSASDILLEPRKDHVEIRLRVDGVLHKIGILNNDSALHIVSRIKILANLDPTEKRRVQEGQYTIDLDGILVNFRIEIAQTVFGELVVIRIHERKTIVMKLEELGFNNFAFTAYNKMLYQKSGLILVCGPTGSGKTTTLYSTISRMGSGGDNNVMTIENPVEFQLEGINQMQTNFEMDFTFAIGLKTILRLSPDIVLVGEIRDKETANIAIESGLTGQLVLSTLHAEDSVRALFRLLDLKIEPYLLKSTLVGIVSQRLVRTNCPLCKVSYQPSNREIEIMTQVLGRTPTQLIKSKGCEQCNGIGFKGRMGIYEVLLVDSLVRSVIGSKVNEEEVRKLLTENGFITLMKDGLEKAEQGITTVDEVLRNSLRAI